MSILKFLVNVLGVWCACHFFVGAKGFGLPAGEVDSPTGVSECPTISSERWSVTDHKLHAEGCIMCSVRHLCFMLHYVNSKC